MRNLLDEDFENDELSPVVKRLQKRFQRLARTALPASKLGQAVTYANNRWPRLVGYAKAGFGHVNID